MDRPEREDRKFADYYPGPEYLDIASLDVYGEFKQSYYDDLLKVAAGKPLALAEVGRAPTIEILTPAARLDLVDDLGRHGRRQTRARVPIAMQALVNDRAILEPERPGLRQGDCPDPDRLRPAGGTPGADAANAVTEHEQTGLMPKSEIRDTKFETQNPNDRNAVAPRMIRFEFLGFVFWICFGFRISKFGAEARLSISGPAVILLL